MRARDRRSASFRSRSMLDGCGIETRLISRESLGDGSRRDRCSMAVGSRHRVAESLAADSLRRDRCSMAVGSRRHRRAERRQASSSRSMLDGCGIETVAPRSAGLPRTRRSRSMLDDCGIETLRCQGRAWGRPLVAIDARWLWDRDLFFAGTLHRILSVAIDARWLWDRDTPTHDEQHDGAGVAIDARWLWDRDTECDSSASLSAGSRSMLVGSRQQHRESWVRQGSSSRSMLDGCGIETIHDVAIDARWLWDRDQYQAPGRRAARGVAIDARWLWDRDLDGDLEQSLAASVAIDARWLWDRDSTSLHGNHRRVLGRDRCSMAVGSRRSARAERAVGARSSRSMLDGCGIET